MKIDRIITIIQILTNYELVTAKSLAKKLEVSTRTVYRDIESISQAGIPIISLQGKNGGIGILDSFKIGTSVWTEDELSNIIVGVKSLHSLNISENTNLLLAKMSSIHEHQQKNDNIIIDLSTYKQNDLVEKVKMIRNSIFEKKVISFSYYTQKTTSKIKIEPHFLIFRFNTWYLLGYSSELSDFYLFKLTRMLKINCTNIVFKKKKVDLNKFSKKDFFNTKQSVKLLMDRSLEYKLLDYMNQNDYFINEDNKIIVSMPYLDEDFMVGLILSMGDKVTVLSPDKLVTRIKYEVKKIINLYN